MGFNTYLFCDCLEGLAALPANTANMFLTSPPYENLRKYEETNDWNFDKFKLIAAEMVRVLMSGGVIIWVVSDETLKGLESGNSFLQALHFKSLGLRLHDTMLYAKKNFIPLTHNRYEQCFEYMFCFSKGKPETFTPIMETCKTSGDRMNLSVKGYNVSEGAQRRRKAIQIVNAQKIASNIFYYPTGSDRTGHPATFPLQLAKDQISTWSKEDDVIIDPFAGSGQTGIACIDLNRQYILFEKVRKYYDIIDTRISARKEKILNDLL